VYRIEFINLGGRYLGATVRLYRPCRGRSFVAELRRERTRDVLRKTVSLKVGGVPDGESPGKKPGILVAKREELSHFLKEGKLVLLYGISLT